MASNIKDIISSRLKPIVKRSITKVGRNIAIAGTWLDTTAAQTLLDEISEKDFEIIELRKKNVFLEKKIQYIISRLEHDSRNTVSFLSSLKAIELVDGD